MTAICVFVRIETASPVRLWSGPGLYEAPADAVEPVPALYRGAGVLNALPAVTALINGAASRVDFGLSGVDAEVMALADAEADDVRGRLVRIAIAHEVDYRPTGPLLWLWTGEADAVSTDRSSDRDGEVTRSVTLSVGSVFTGRRRPVMTFFTDVHQRRRSPGDRFCERVPLHTTTSTVTWPRLS